MTSSHIIPLTSHHPTPPHPTHCSAGYNRATGFVAEDNSGRANIFPTKQQAYINSNTADAAARQGLGGAQGAPPPR